jgi:septal ring factor EnvC (AmiA/AmiB activator)
MADMSGAAVAESSLERVQRQIAMVEQDIEGVRGDLLRLRTQLNTEKDEGEKKKIEVEIRENKGLLKSLTDKELILRADARGFTPAPPSACLNPT